MVCRDRLAFLIFPLMLLLENYQVICLCNAMMFYVFFQLINDWMYRNFMSHCFVVKQAVGGDTPGTPPFVRTATIYSPRSARGTARSPRCRNDRSVVGRAVGRSPSSRGRRDSAVGQGITEATLDQSANCGWATFSGHMSVISDAVRIGRRRLFFDANTLLQMQL